MAGWKSGLTPIGRPCGGSAIPAGPDLSSPLRQWREIVYRGKEMVYHIRWLREYEFVFNGSLEAVLPHIEKKISVGSGPGRPGHEFIASPVTVNHESKKRCCSTRHLDWWGYNCCSMVVLRQCYHI